MMLLLNANSPLNRKVSIANHVKGVLYATTMLSNSSKVVLEAGLTKLLAAAEIGGENLLLSLYYEQSAELSCVSLDLAFDDVMLENVENQWKFIDRASSADGPSMFMRFQDREGTYDDDDAGDEF